MATWRFETSDGTYEVDAADTATEAQVRAAFEAQHRGAPSAPPPAATRGSSPDTRSSLTRLYEDYLAKPATQAFAELIGGSERSPLPGGYRSPAAETIGQKAATAIVPQSPTEALVTAGTMGAGPAARVLPGALGVFARAHPALGRVLGGAVGGEAGNQLAGGPTGAGAAVGGGAGALGEAGGALGSKVIRSLPGIKGRVNDQQTEGVLKVLTDTVPELGPVLQRARTNTSPLLKSGQPAAAAMDAALSTSGKNVLSDVMERGMLDATLAAPGQGIRSPALEQAWRLLPESNELALRLKGSLAPNPVGEFSVNQAERIIGELGNATFKGEPASPLARDIGMLELEKLYRRAIKETEGSLPGVAGDIFRETRGKFAGGTALLETLRAPQAFQGMPNRLFSNQRAMADYVSQNRAELLSKLGPQQFEALVAAVNRGGQIGTRDLTASGSGEMGTALSQVYGRGQGGAPQIAGSLARTAFPNLGTEYTGRAPYTLPPQLQAILDVMLQRAGGAGLPGGQ